MAKKRKRKRRRERAGSSPPSRRARSDDAQRAGQRRQRPHGRPAAGALGLVPALGDRRPGRRSCCLFAGFFVAPPRGPIMIGTGLVLGSLAGLELSVREHFAGYRSHTLLIAGFAAVVVTAGLFALTESLPWSAWPPAPRPSASAPGSLPASSAAARAGRCSRSEGS